MTGLVERIRGYEWPLHVAVPCVLLLCLGVPALLVWAVWTPADTVAADVRRFGYDVRDADTAGEVREIEKRLPGIIESLRDLPAGRIEELNATNPEEGT